MPIYSCKHDPTQIPRIVAYPQKCAGSCTGNEGLCTHNFVGHWGGGGVGASIHQLLRVPGLQKAFPHESFSAGGKGGGSIRLTAVGVNLGLRQLQLQQ